MRTRFAIVLAAVFLLGAAASAAVGSNKAKQRGKAEYERICSACHEIGIGTANPRTRAQWAAVVDDMASMGAAGTKAELRLVVDYLSANFGAK